MNKRNINRNLKKAYKMVNIEERKKNRKLIQFDDLKESVIANSINRSDKKKKEKKQEENHNLFDFE